MPGESNVIFKASFHTETIFEILMVYVCLVLLYHKQDLQMFKCFPILTLGNVRSHSAGMFLQLVTTCSEAPAWRNALHRECRGISV